MTRHDYAGPTDLRAMQDLVQRLWSPAQRFHVGDIAWGRYSVPGAEDGYRTALWRDGGTVVAWAWAELPNHLDLLVDPAQESLVPEILDWFASVTDRPDLSCMVMAGDAHVIVALDSYGYQRQADGPFFVQHTHALTSLPAPALPSGFTVHHLQPGDAERRAAAHRLGWSDFGSRVSTESYRRLMETWPYRPDTDLIVEAADGTWVASALGWYDDVNEAGLVEPVSCAPEYRRRGLAQAVNIALLHAFRRLGAKTAVVMPRGDDAYPVPGHLYRSIGFAPAARTYRYAKTR